MTEQKNKINPYLIHRFGDEWREWRHRQHALVQNFEQRRQRNQTIIIVRIALCYEF